MRRNISRALEYFKNASYVKLLIYSETIVNKYVSRYNINKICFKNASYVK